MPGVVSGGSTAFPGPAFRVRCETRVLQSGKRNGRKEAARELSLCLASAHSGLPAFCPRAGPQIGAYGMARRGPAVLMRRRGRAVAFWVKSGSQFPWGEVSCSEASGGSRGSNRFIPVTLPFIEVRRVCLSPSGETSTRT